MKVQHKIRDDEEFTDALKEHIIGKMKRRIKRKSNFSQSMDTQFHTHWKNHSGTYRDPEMMKGPKYWHGNKPPIPDIKIKSHKDLVSALKSISNGDSHQDNYHGVSGLNRERLRLAQSWTDRGISYAPSDIISLNLMDIRKELKPRRIYGKVYRH